jgi:probable phosphoglycerate mutase
VPSRIYLARHGETDWNALGKLQGHTDIALNEQGREQARELAARLRREGVRGVTTSDLSRARETGSIVASSLGVAPPDVDLELRERCFGIFEGLTRAECAASHPDAWRAWVEQTSPPEGAERVDDAILRMTRALTRIAERATDHVVISHGGVMRLWLQRATGEAVPLIANGSVYVVERRGEVFEARAWQG